MPFSTVQLLFIVERFCRMQLYEAVNTCQVQFPDARGKINGVTLHRVPINIVRRIKMCLRQGWEHCKHVFQLRNYNLNFSVI